MAKRNSINLDATVNADGFDISGGTTARKLTVTGGDVTVTGSGSAVITFPSATGTLATLTLEENIPLIFDATLSADGKYSGLVRAGTAGTALSFGYLVYLAAADSRWELADADAATTSDRLLGMCVLAAAADGSATTILLHGFIRADAQFPSMTIGSAVYVGETPGAVQTAIPTGADAVIRRVGYAWTADELYFCPSQDSQTVVA